MYPYIDLGFYEIPTYWLFNVLGIIIAYYVAKIINMKHQAYRLPKQDLFNLMLYVVMGGILGSRLLFIMTYIPTMIEHPEYIMMIIFGGGSVFYGGAIGGILGAFLYIKMYGLDPIKYFNVVAVAVPLGHAVGRVGCFCAGCCYGAPTHSSWGVSFPASDVHEQATELLHPTQLYEVFYNLIIFAILLYFFTRNKKHKPYFFVSWYLILYGVFRFINEFFRGDEYRGIFLLSTSQWISVVMVILGVLSLIVKIEKFKIFKENPPTSKSYRAFLERKKQRNQGGCNEIETL